MKRKGGFSIKYYFLAILIIIISGFQCYVIPNTYENIFDSLASYKNTIPLLGYFLLMLISVAVLKYMQGMLEFQIQREESIVSQRTILKEYLNAKQPSNYNVNDMVGLISKTTQDIQAYNITIFVNIFSVLSILVFATFYILSVSIHMLMITIFLSLSMVILIFYRKNSLQELVSNITQQENKIINYQWEYINNQEIGPFLNYNRLFNHYIEQNNIKKNYTIKYAKTIFLSRFTKTLGNIILTIFIAISGGFLCYFDKVTTAKLFGILTIMPYLSTALFVIPSIISDYYSKKGKEDIIPEEFKTPKLDHINSQIKMIAPGSIEVNNLSIRDTLYKVNYKAFKGRLCVISGVSGCGKTTLLRALLGFVKPDKGIILYDGCLLNEIDKETLYSSVFYISSNPFIADTSFKNYVLGNEKNIDEKYYDILSILKIRYLDDRKNIEIDKLSAGEKQKIMIAKMIFSNRSIWICDEPTNKLDSTIELDIMNMLKNTIKERNILAIFVSHRANTISYADDHWIIESGKIEKVQ